MGNLRNVLKGIKGEVIDITGRFIRVGLNTKGEKSALFRSIRKKGEKRLIADHIWIKFKRRCRFKENRYYSIKSEVISYMKKDRKNGILTVDYGLEGIFEYDILYPQFFKLKNKIYVDNINVSDIKCGKCRHLSGKYKDQCNLNGRKIYQYYGNAPDWCPYIMEYIENNINFKCMNCGGYKIDYENEEIVCKIYDNIINPISKLIDNMNLNIALWCEENR